MIICSCTGATDRDVREGTARGQAAGQHCGGCRPAVEPLRPPACFFCGRPATRPVGATLLGRPVCGSCTCGARDPVWMRAAVRKIMRANAQGE